jgi:Flp pilus assembly protein TadG
MSYCRRDGERGQSLPLVIIMFIVLCGFVGLTIDVGFGLLQKRRLQAAVDMGALSGAQKLPGTDAGSDATSFTRANFALASDQHVDVTATTSCMVSGCRDHDRLRLTARTETPTFFVRLFGIDHWTVAAKGAACGPCDSSVATFDVVVVLDRSGSMSGQDMTDAREGIRELLGYFDPERDRVALAVLESADSRAPYFSTGTAPCESDRSSFSSSSYLASAYTGYGGAAGAFMDGTSSDHDAWVVVDLDHGDGFKNANGTLKSSSPFLSALDCVKDGGSTPIGPAMQAATDELEANGRPDSVKVIVYLGDGGASSTPVKRECRSRKNNRWGDWRACTTDDAGGGSSIEWRVTGDKSWYSWSSGNRDRPCADAVAQSKRAANYGIDVYAIGYGVSTDWCRPGVTNSPPEQPYIRQSETIRQMASDDDLYFEQPERGDLTEVFGQIGRVITAGGTRLVE